MAAYENPHIIPGFENCGSYYITAGMRCRLLWRHHLQQFREMYSAIALQPAAPGVNVVPGIILCTHLCRLLRMWPDFYHGLCR